MLVQRKDMGMGSASDELRLLDGTSLHISVMETLFKVNKLMGRMHLSAIFQSRYCQANLKKPGSDPELLSNYWPISLLPFLSKVLEKVVAKQLTASLDKHNLLARFKSGFRPCQSTETAVVRIASDILSSNESGKFTALVILGLSAAFDTIDHEILLSRL